MCTLLTASLLGSGFLALQQRQNMRLHQSNLTVISATVNAMKTQHAVAQRYVDDYQRLTHATASTSNIRIRWIDAIERILSDPGITFSRYEFNDPVLMQPVEIEQFKAIDVIEHPLRLNIEVLHDGHLVGLLKAMEHYNGGVTENRGCLVQRHEAGLSANCLFSIYQIEPLENHNTSRNDNDQDDHL